jgi:hypothetical protein
MLADTLLTISSPPQPMKVSAASEPNMALSTKAAKAPKVSKYAWLIVSVRGDAFMTLAAVFRAPPGSPRV